MTERDLLEKFNAPEGAKLITTYKNGNIKVKYSAPCDRCGGGGIFYTGVNNGIPTPSWVEQGVCFKCNGSGRMIDTMVLMTPENREKANARKDRLQVRRAAKIAAIAAEQEAKRQAEQEAKELREAEIRERKAQSDYFGEIGQRVSLDLVMVASPNWEQKVYCGYGTRTMYQHIFRDSQGNTFTWKTDKTIYIPLGDGQFQVAERNDLVSLVGTIKEHIEYKGEKQTVLTRCKITSIKNFEEI